MNNKYSSETLWHWGDLCRALRIEQTLGPNVSGVQFDSRRVQPGDLFVALPGNPGPRFNVAERSARDGHEYVIDAIQNGAVGALIHKDVESTKPMLRVENTIDGLWDLARFRRAQLQCPVVAVTGSSGKTTLKSFLTQALKATSTKESFNNYIGLPLSVAVTPINADAAVYEIGTNHEGEIAPLSEVARPDIAVVLNVLPVHIGNFPSLEALTREKFSICHGLNSSSGFVCNIDLATHKLRPKVARTVTFGFGNEPDVQIAALDKDYFCFSCAGESINVKVPGGGRHRAETLGATGAVLHCLGRPLTELLRITADLPTGRGNTHEVNGVLVIDESYNSNPTSTREALLSLANRPVDGKKIAVLSQMNELGNSAVEYHTALAPYANEVDVVICVGALMESLYNKLDDRVESRFYETVCDELMQDLLRLATVHDVVLVKGSHSFFWENDFVNRFVRTLRDK